MVIDVWGGNVELAQAMPPRADVVAPSTVKSFAPSGMTASADSQRLAAGSGVRSQSASAPKMTGGQSAKVARAFLKLSDTGSGEAILTTAGFYDTQAPRQVRLTMRQLQQVNGLLIFVLIGLAFVGLIGLLTTPFLLLVPVILLFNAGKGLRGTLTKNLDALPSA